MNVNIRNRFIVFGVLVMALFVILFVQLIQLTLVKGEYYADMSGELDIRTITVSGARGSILDRNGLPLAYDQKSYDVQFYRDPSKSSETYRAYYTGIIIETIETIEQNRGETVDTFSIHYDEDTGEYYFKWGNISEEAQTAREKNWRKNMYVGTDRTPEEIYLYLRQKYQIPSEMGYEEARKILSIWQDVQQASWVAYKPIDVAYNVSIQTVSEIETHGAELEGMSIAESTVRIYTRNSVAAHAIGYLGRIEADPDNPDKLDEWVKKGYSVDDLVGTSGIEASMEEYLTGNSTDRQGVKEVEIDNMAIVVNELSSTEPTQGDNVMLTIDIPLQLALEESLATNIPLIKKIQTEKYYDDPSDYDEWADSIDDIDLAETGAAVVLDVKTGEVLGIASYPSFDLNLFTGGISEEDFEPLKNDEVATPLFNKAIASRGTPGSIFKMVTGLGGLMEGVLGLDEEIDDLGTYDVYVVEGFHGPGCWQHDSSKHQDQTIIDGLKNSCNYFFYTVADRLKIDGLDKWGDKFGLTASTGIEIPGERIGQIGNQDILFDKDKTIDEQKALTWTPYLVKKAIVEEIEMIEKVREVEYDDALIDSTAEEIVYLAGKEWTADENDRNILKDARGLSMGDYVCSILFENLQISETAARQNSWVTDITSFLDELRWTPTSTITTGIGQNLVQVTPIAVARYVAALVNGGTVFDTHIVDKIIAQDGSVIRDTQPVVYDTLGARPEYLDAIKEGMREVVSAEDGGTAAPYFKDFKYTNDIGGKTGTAEVSKIDLENNSWFVCFAPYDEPEIAIVAYVPHGYKGGLSSIVARDIVQFYMDEKKVVAEQTIPDFNSLID